MIVFPIIFSIKRHNIFTLQCIRCFGTLRIFKCQSHCNADKCTAMLWCNSNYAFSHQNLFKQYLHNYKSETDKSVHCNLVSYFFFVFSSSAFCRALFSLTPSNLLSARACRIASKTLYFFSSSVTARACATGRTCLIGITGPLSCTAILHASGCGDKVWVSMVGVLPTL